MKQDVKPDLGETPRKPCLFCGEVHSPVHGGSGTTTPPRITEEMVEINNLIDELQDLRRAKIALKKKKRLVKARLLIAQEERNNKDKEESRSVGMKSFPSLAEAMNLMASSAKK